MTRPSRNRGYFTDRSFRSRSAWKRYAKALEIDWQPEWQKGETIYWHRIPVAIAARLRDYSKSEQQRCQYRVLPPKHKYAIIRGIDRRETKRLLQRFAQDELIGLPYPKRGASEMPQEVGAVALQ